jgi:hypothetical protein
VSEVCREATLKESETAVDLQRSPATSTRYYNVITVMEPHSAAYGCAYAKTPSSAKALVAGSLGTSEGAPPAGPHADSCRADQRFLVGRLVVEGRFRPAAWDGSA